MPITIVTYGLSKRSVYPSATLKFDCQVLDNPPQVLWKLDGRSPDLRSHIVSQLISSQKKRNWFQWTYKTIETTLEKFKAAKQIEDANIVIAFCCQGGRHRSASIAEIVAQMLTNTGYTPKINHLELQ